MQWILHALNGARSLRDSWRWKPAGRFVALTVVATTSMFAIVPAATAATIGPATLIGSVPATGLPEVSGIVDSRANADTFWVHNDKGDSAQFYATNHAGSLLGTFPLASAPSGDWEDIAIGPKPGDGNYLYLGDIGDNNNNRTFITVYRTDEPQSPAGASIPVGSYSALHLQYPNGPRNAESLFVDPMSGDLFIITKSTTIPEIYSAPNAAFDDVSQTVTLTAEGNLGGPLRTPTAADISPDGRFILVRSSKSSTGYLYEREVGQSVADALHGTGTSFVLGLESQGEAIGWAADGTNFYSTSESDGFPAAPIYSYAFNAPPLLAGDYNDDHVVDAADYSIWRDHLGGQFQLLNEGDTPGEVTPEDYAVWREHFGEVLSGAAALTPALGTAVGVPEPAGFLLSLAWVLPVYCRRR